MRMMPPLVLWGALMSSDPVMSPSLAFYRPAAHPPQDTPLDAPGSSQSPLTCLRCLSPHPAGTVLLALPECGLSKASLPADPREPPPPPPTAKGRLTSAAILSRCLKVLIFGETDTSENKHWNPRFRTQCSSLALQFQSPSGTAGFCSPREIETKR